MNNFVNIRTKAKVWMIRATMVIRYWEDATVNGKKCENAENMPMSDGETWDICINVEDGKIMSWPQGTTADVHFKVCDGGIYELIDYNGDVIFEKDGYVPNIMCPGGRGYGDYVIMRIDETGKIENWIVDLDDFQDEINNQCQSNRRIN